jgi:hypothetical protein
MRSRQQWRDHPRSAGRSIVVDIDGVLADASGRQHFLNNVESNRDWRGFFGAVGSDSLLPDTQALLRLLPDDVTIVLLSARPAWVFDITLTWLQDHEVPWHLLVLRADQSVAGAAGFKRSVVHGLIDQGFSIEFAFDDDERIIDMYHSEGIPALYVHSGYYAPPSGR